MKVKFIKGNKKFSIHEVSEKEAKKLKDLVVILDEEVVDEEKHDEQCKAFKADGDRCSMNTKDGEDYCHFHKKD